MSVMLYSPDEMAQLIAKRVRANRLQLNWSQQTLSARAGVSYGTLKKFERTGQIALLSLLKLALVLDMLSEFQALFVDSQQMQMISLDDVIKARGNSRKRGRQ